ncbi:hypothetical protein TNCV_4385261 [Trichonephila clavipes]|nr:hypothetical protein TNCV_4385261 [Trichonephila clavipes]
MYAANVRSPRCRQTLIRLLECCKQNPDSSEKGRLAIRVPGFVIDHTIKDAFLCAAAMVFELRVHAAANVVKPFVQTLVVLQTTPNLDSGLVTWLHDSFKAIRVTCLPSLLLVIGGR